MNLYDKKNDKLIIYPFVSILLRFKFRFFAILIKSSYSSLHVLLYFLTSISTKYPNFSTISSATSYLSKYK